MPANFYDLSNGQLTITHSMTIAGDSARTTSLDQFSSTAARVFAIGPARGSPTRPTVTISGLAMAFGGIGTAGFGGDIFNEGTLTLLDDEIFNGSATSGSGAGIANDGGTLTVDHSLIDANSSTNANGNGDAGGILNYGDSSVGTGTLTVTNSTISNNTAALGGGIVSRENPNAPPASPNTTTIVNSTIAFNDGGTAGTAGGGLLAEQGTITVQNSIVALNTVDNPATGTPSNCASGGISSLGFNLESATDCGFTSTGDLQNMDPGFLNNSLDEMGGNANVLALKATSPAVDAIPAGTSGCSGTDQRDVSRPQGPGCDIGAYELVEPDEGQLFSEVVGQASGGVRGTPSIDWGDGTAASSGTLGTNAEVTGSHTYAEEGDYSGTLSWLNSDGFPETRAFEVKVADAPLTAAGDNIGATTGIQFSGQVAHFSDANPGATASDFAATILWGDGGSSSGTVSAGTSGFVVTGTHTYTTAASDTVSVTITDAGGASAATQSTATVVPRPTVSSVSPTSGPQAGATSVTITGTGFTAASAVDFGSTAASSFTVDSATQITAVSPAGTGTVDITVTTPAGTTATSSADQFTYNPPPTVTGVSPNNGPQAGGTSVTVTGTAVHPRDRGRVRVHGRGLVHGRLCHADHRDLPGWDRDGRHHGHDACRRNQRDK